MKSTSGASRTRCSARIRSAANTKLPFRMATTSRFSSLAPAISLGQLVEAPGDGLGREDDLELGVAVVVVSFMTTVPNRFGLMSGEDSRTLRPRGNPAIT